MNADFVGSAVLWEDVACSSATWQSALTDVNLAWDLWSGNAESWLQAHGVLVSEKAERRLGSIPTLTSIVRTGLLVCKALRRDSCEGIFDAWMRPWLCPVKVL